MNTLQNREEDILSKESTEGYITTFSHILRGRYEGVDQEILDCILKCINFVELDDSIKEFRKVFDKTLAAQKKQLLSRVLEEVKGMGKRRLESPRSFGDGDIVDVSPGYNQALEDLRKALTTIMEE